MKTAVAVLAVCSLVICLACSCAEKPDAGAGQPDVRLSEPDVRPVQQTEYDKIISEIKNNFSKPQRNVLEATHYCLEIASLIDEEIYPGRKLDRFELERQFRKIAAEEYDFSNFEDETFNLLMGVIEKIKNLRISEGDREILNEMYVREKRISWIHALPEYIPINVDWKQFVASSVQTLIYSTVNYLKIRNEIELEHAKDSWELDKEVIKNDSDDIQNKLANLYRICKNYKVKYVEPGELLTEFNKIEDMIKNGVTDEVWKPFDDRRDFYRKKVNEDRFKMYSTYWYQRGYLAWRAYSEEKNKNEEDRREAMGCFDVYQELTTHSIVKYNPVAIDVAMMQIDLQPTNRAFLENQLEIIKRNLNRKSLDYQSICLFCGQIYWALKNYKEAADMFQLSEKAGNDKREKEVDIFCNIFSDTIKEFEGSDKAAQKNFKKTKADCNLKKEYTIGDFAVKDDDKNLHFLPKLDAEFLARMGHYDSLIKSGEDIKDVGMNLVDKISNGVSYPYISPWEFLLFASYVKGDRTKKKYYEEILPKVLLKSDRFDCSEYFNDHPEWKSDPVGKQRLPYELKYLRYSSSFLSKKRFFLRVPYQYALLSNIKFSMGLLRGEEVVTFVPCDSETMEKDEKNNVVLCLWFPLDEEELIKNKIDGFRFDFEYEYFKSAITFHFDRVLTKSMGSDFYKDRPGYITFELKKLGDLGSGTSPDVGAKR